MICRVVAGMVVGVLASLVMADVPADRLPDCSHAGYHDGDAAPPGGPVTANVRDLGVKGDGATDDAPALQRAIDAAGPGVLLFPAGRYVLGSPLTIAKAHLVLCGDPAGGTVLVVPHSLQELRPGKLVDGGKLSYAFGGAFVQVKGSPGGAKLADVTAPAKRGDVALTLSRPPAIQPGARVRLLMNNARSLGRHLHADRFDAGDATFSHSHFVDFAARVASVRGSVVTLDRPLRTDVRPGEWAPELWSYEPTVTEVGLEHLTFEFPGVPKKKHLQEEGFNAVQFIGCVDCWATDVTVIDADIGIKLDACRNVTVDGFVARAVHRTNPTGHHALWASSSTQDCLFTHFDIRTQYVHDLSVEGFANGNVFEKGCGVALNLDHHRNAPYANLFTELHTDDVSRLWQSSGREDRGPHGAARSTVWTLTYDRGKLPPLPDWPLLNVVNVKGYPLLRPSDAGVWCDESPVVNLYEAQRRKR